MMPDPDADRWAARKQELARRVAAAIDSVNLSAGQVSDATRADLEVEVATLEWIDWFNHRRLHEHCDDLSPAEYETLYYRDHRTQPSTEFSNQ